MYSKKFMYDLGQKTCIRLIEDGYVHTFEEILNLMIMNKKVREGAGHGLDKTMPSEFRSEPEIFQYIEENLIDAEEAMRKCSYEDNYRSRMKLGKYFHEIEGYHWLAVYFYKSSQHYEFDISIDVKLIITSLQQQALLEESRGNIDVSSKYLEKALAIANTNFLDAEDPVMKRLNECLCRIYQLLGSKYLEQESDGINAENSISLKFFTKASQIAMTNDDLETKASCQALLGKAMMKFNNDESALKSFEEYIILSEKCNDNYGMCQGFFAKSEIFKRAGDLDKSISALNTCQDIAKQHCFDIPVIFSSVSLGQIETAKRKYFKANEHFKEAYNAIIISNEDYARKKSLKKLTKVMYGIGKAHLTFNRLVTTLQSPIHMSMPKLLSWRHTSGPFTGEITEKQDHLINMDETEKDDEEVELSIFIEKLINQELNQE